MEKNSRNVFQQVQRFILAEKMFWGKGHFKSGSVCFLSQPQIVTFLVIG